MLKIDIKDKELLKCLDAYCTIMNIKTNDYIIDAIQTQLNKDIRKCIDYAKEVHYG